jgi:hypothetical protein
VRNDWGTQNATSQTPYSHTDGLCFVFVKHFLSLASFSVHMIRETNVRRCLRDFDSPFEFELNFNSILQNQLVKL